MEREESAALPDLERLTRAAAELLGRAIEEAEPKDIKELRQITGALKELKELMEEGAGPAAGLVIRIEGDPDGP